MSFLTDSYQIFAAEAALFTPAGSQEKRRDTILKCDPVRKPGNAVSCATMTNRQLQQTRKSGPLFLAPGGQATLLVYAQ
ncbi:MAG: hypothetical protein ABID63_02495 [Pseudomonadota bacterium]